MRIRSEFAEVYKVTLVVDKSKVGKELMTLPYLYSLEKHLGAMLPPQVVSITY